MPPKLRHYPFWHPVRTLNPARCNSDAPTRKLRRHSGSSWANLAADNDCAAFSALVSARVPAMRGSVSVLGIAIGLILLGTGCSRQKYRQRADRDVSGILAQKNVVPNASIQNWQVYPDSRARYADPTSPGSRGTVTSTRSSLGTLSTGPRKNPNPSPLWRRATIPLRPR